MQKWSSKWLSISMSYRNIYERFANGLNFSCVHDRDRDRDRDRVRDRVRDRDPMN